MISMSYAAGTFGPTMIWLRNSEKYPGTTASWMLSFNMSWNWSNVR
jgi:hypothetical protein